MCARAPITTPPTILAITNEIVAAPAGAATLIVGADLH
jgi:hypothetical protein